MASGIKRQHEPPRIVGDLLQSEIAEKQARSIRWPRLIGRLLKQHFGTSRALQQLRIEQDEAEQQWVMEYLALADWAAQAAAQAVKANPKATDLRVPLDGLAKSLQAQVLLILGDVAEDKQYFDQLHLKLDERFSARLGLNLSKTV